MSEHPTSKSPIEAGAPDRSEWPTGSQNALSQRLVEPPLEEFSNLRQELTQGERMVFDFFHRNLSPKWEIYVQPHLNGLRPDFVLLNPDIGIAVFEVKDWNLDAMDYFPKRMSQNRTDLWGSRPSRWCNFPDGLRA
ncbi:NERD domain-containing protein [Mesobacterium pallidum]|uniref:NERD domain-containing protein n=1 Tax=Mesobacterium pallidum TaxID=2872037 RepID=UPI001EE28E2F